MNHLLRLIAVVPLISLLAAGEEDKADLKRALHEPIEIGCYFNAIEGSILQISMVSSRQGGTGWTRQECSIVFSSERQITPILSLPSIQNDTYTVKGSGGMIEIATSRKGKVVEFNLRGIAPNTITEPLTEPDKSILTWDHRRGAPTIGLPAGWESLAEGVEMRLDPEEELDGTTLTVFNAFASRRPSGESRSKCLVGYRMQAEMRSIFTPVISLPYLIGDEYEVKHTNGNVVVTTKRSHSLVLTLHLAKLSPTSITRVQSEQAGAGQPATRPVDESEGGDKPQPEAEGRDR